MDIESGLVSLEHIESLVVFQNHARDITLQVADSLLCLLLVEIGLIVPLDLFKKSLFGDALRK